EKEGQGEEDIVRENEEEARPKNPQTPAETATPSDRPVEISKKDKRRAKEAKKKAEEDAAKAAAKEARKSKKSQPPVETKATDNERVGDPFVPPKKKGKGKAKPEVEEFAEEKVARAIQSIEEKREKMVEKWGEDWSDLLRKLGDLGLEAPVVLCLGLGRPFSDRTAQIQLALILELARGLKVRDELDS
ncbi:hypothetical protein P7C73_g4725, partial [Tremellales sp. Uapishka_1]